MHSKTPSAVTIVHQQSMATAAVIPATLIHSCVPIDEFLLYACDFSLAIFSGVTFALFNLLIGQYLTVSVSNNGHPEYFAHFQCIVHFLCAGFGLTLLGFLHHISVNTENPTIQHKLSPVYRRTLGIFIRDLAFLIASISIGFNRSWALCVPILLVPILVTAWTTLLQKQKPPIVRGLFLAGPLCFFFLNMSLGGFYGVKLIDLGLIDQPGIIFTIVAGIGSSAVQFAKARAQFKPFLPAHHAPQMYVHDENLDKPEYEKNPIEDYTDMDNSSPNCSANCPKISHVSIISLNGNSSPNGNAKGNGNENGIGNGNRNGNGNGARLEFGHSLAKGNGGQTFLKGADDRPKLGKIFHNWCRIQLLMLKKWPSLCLVGLLACFAHAFGYPVFTRTTGLFFSVFELKLDPSDSLLWHVHWICLVYGIMGIIVFVAVTCWNGIFGKMGIKLRSMLQEEIYEKKQQDQQQQEKEEKANALLKNVDWGQIEMVPLLSTEFFYGIFCMSISIGSSLQNNRPMGLLAVWVFSCQVILQHLACRYLNKTKYGRAICFASTNGMQQASQAIAYAGGFILVQFGLTSALNVFKIIQTMHLGSMGMTSVVLLANDFAKGSRELKLILDKTGNKLGRRIMPMPINVNNNAALP